MVTCKDCGNDLDIDPTEVYECDTDCKTSPLCRDCYEDNHADGGCGEDPEEDPLPDDYDTSPAGEWQ